METDGKLRGSIMSWREQRLQSQRDQGSSFDFATLSWASKIQCFFDPQVLKLLRAVIK